MSDSEITYIQGKLFALQDLEYKVFHSRLMPTVSPDRVIGVRTPELRALAGTIYKETDINAFLGQLPHMYYEENNLHGFLLEKIKDFDECIRAVDEFLPYVDNWATCDLMSPKVFAREPEALLDKIKEWLASGKTYTVRFGIVNLMRYYLDDRFEPEYLELVASLDLEEYYVNMAAAWFFATALDKQYTDAVKYIEQGRLGAFVHNKAIQKAIESRRIPREKKEYLRTLKNSNH